MPNKEEIQKEISISQYPLKKYYLNVFDFIENRCQMSKEQHQANVDANKVDPGIGFKVGGPIGIGPYAVSIKIVFPEAFLAFLWTTIYWLFTYFEKVIIPRKEAAYLKKSFEISSALKQELSKVDQIFEWGCSLRENYSDWPIHIISLTENDTWIDKITNMWTAAAGFTFYHEYAHALGERNEEAADEYAISNVILDNRTATQNERIRNILAAIGVFCSFFFLSDSPKHIAQQPSHPDLDIRLEGLIKKIEIILSEDELRYVKDFSTFSIGMFCNRLGVFEKSSFDGNTEDEMFNNALAYCKKLKKLYPK